MTKRTTGAAQAAPRAPKPTKRKGGGPSGKNLQPQRQLRAPAAFWALLDRAIAANAEGRAPGGYSGWSDWARHHLAIAAADELDMDPTEALRLLPGDG